jgi:prenyltransferase beta subunit
MADFVTGGGSSVTTDERLSYLEKKHLDYINKVSSDTTSFEFAVTQHLRMSGVYWGVTAMALMGRDLLSEMDSECIVDWVQKCQHESGICFTRFYLVLCLFPHMISQVDTGEM